MSHGAGTPKHIEFRCNRPTKRNHGGLCQRSVSQEGDACKYHRDADQPPPTPTESEERKQETRRQRQAEVDTQKLLDAADEANLVQLSQIERGIEGHSAHLSAAIALMEASAAEARIKWKETGDPQYLELSTQTLSRLGQLDYRRTQGELRQLEISKRRRELAKIETGNADVLSFLAQQDMHLESGFIRKDITPRASLAHYTRWLGETITVQDVLDGKAEHSNAPWEMQAEILTALFWPEKLGKPDLNRVVVVTGNGMGKSYFTARAILFNAIFRYPSLTIVTGPRLSQVRDTLSSEVRRLHATLGLPGKANVLRWLPNEDNDRAYVTYTSAQSDDAFAGHHGRILVVGEEASGIPNHIFESINGLMSGDDCKLLLIGNMHRRQGQFYHAYADTQENDPRTHVIQRSAFEHPNLIHKDFIQARGGTPIIPHAVSAQWVEESLADWGEDSHRAAIRIYGQPPKQDSSAIIPLYLMETACEYEWIPEVESDIFEYEYEVVAADIAGMGDDLTVIFRWQWGRMGHRVEHVKTMSHARQGQIADAMIAAATRPKNDNLFFSCDTNGEGAGILEQLEIRGIEPWALFGYKAHNSPDDELKHDQQIEYDNLEAEAWGRLSRWLERSNYSIDREEQGDITLRIDMPQNHHLVRELTERDHDNDTGKVRIMPKKEYRKIIGHSPDVADACVIASRAVHLVQKTLLKKAA